MDNDHDQIEEPEGQDTEKGDDAMSRMDRVKHHLRENKKVYLVGAGVGVGCFAAGYLLRRPKMIEIPMIINNMPKFVNKPVIEINNTVNNGGHMRKIVKCLETGQLWLSVTEAAREQGKNLSLMSQHLNHPDVVPEINGLHFVIEALTTN